MMCVLCVDIECILCVQFFQNHSQQRCSVDVFACMVRSFKSEFLELSYALTLRNITKAFIASQFYIKQISLAQLSLQPCSPQQPH